MGLHKERATDHIKDDEHDGDFEYYRDKDPEANRRRREHMNQLALLLSPTEGEPN